MTLPLEIKINKVNENYPTEAQWCLNTNLTGTVISLFRGSEYHTGVYCGNTIRILTEVIWKINVLVQSKDSIGRWMQSDKFEWYSQTMTLIYFCLTQIYYYQTSNKQES